MLPSQHILAICSSPDLFGCSKQATAYAAALAKAQQLGWKLEPVDFTPLFTLASFLYEGPWLAERYAAIEKFIDTVPAEDMNPVVRDIIMDWSAMAIPAGFRDDGLPFGITLIAGAWEESWLFELGRQWLSDAPRLLGATSLEFQEPLFALPFAPDSMKASLFKTTLMAPSYQLFALQTGSSVQKPGLKRVVDGGKSIEVEVWNMPTNKHRKFPEYD